MLNTNLQEITINNQKLTYVELGKGFPTIVILGWLASIEKFRYKKIFSKFENNFLIKNKLIFLHLSNFGKSQLSKNPYTLNDYVEEINKFIKIKKYKKINLVGHSAGGRHVLKYTIKYPKKVNKLILISAAGFTPKKPKSNQLIKVNFYFHKFSAVIPKKFKMLQKTYINLYNSDLREEIKEIKKPVLILWGKKDTTISHKKANIFKDYIKNSKLIKFKNFDHMLTLKSYIWKKVFEFIEE